MIMWHSLRSSLVNYRKKIFDLKPEIEETLRLIPDKGKFVTGNKSYS